jgi:hypothetical protein
MLVLKQMDELLQNVERLIHEDQRSFAGIFPYDQPAGTFKVLSGSGTSLTLDVLRRAVDMSKAAKADDGQSANVMEHAIMPQITQCVKSCMDNYAVCSATPNSDSSLCEGQQMSCSKECILKDHN